jgi:hypothetical protein
VRALGRFNAEHNYLVDAFVLGSGAKLQIERISRKIYVNRVVRFYGHTASAHRSHALHFYFFRFDGNVHFPGSFVDHSPNVLFAFIAVGCRQYLAIESIFKLVVVEIGRDNRGPCNHYRDDNGDSEDELNCTHTMIRRPDHANKIQRDGRSNFLKYSLIAAMLASCISRVER